MSFGYVYQTLNILNNKIYVGQHKSEFYDSKYYGSGKYLKRAIKRYGIENFINKILEWCNTKEELNDREIYWINKLKSRNKKIGYNITEGGEGTFGFSGMEGKSQSEETKNKISLSNIGKHSNPETNDKISKAILGRKIINNGSINKVVFNPEDYYKKGWKPGIINRKKSFHPGSKNYIWINDGKYHKMIKEGEEIPLNWKKGYLANSPEVYKKIGLKIKGKHVDKKWINNGLIEKWVSNYQDYLNKNWKLGRLKIIKEKISFKLINNYKKEVK